jgi:hypothetical protein
MVLTFASRSEIGRFVSMLRNPSPILRACAAFALLQVCFLFPFSTDNAAYLVALSRVIIVRHGGILSIT